MRPYETDTRTSVRATFNGYAAVPSIGTATSARANFSRPTADHDSIATTSTSNCYPSCILSTLLLNLNYIIVLHFFYFHVSFHFFSTYVITPLFLSPIFFFFFFFNDPAPPEIYPLPLHAPLPIWPRVACPIPLFPPHCAASYRRQRSGHSPATRRA